MRRCKYKRLRAWPLGSPRPELQARRSTRRHPHRRRHCASNQNTRPFAAGRTRRRVAVVKDARRVAAHTCDRRRRRGRTLGRRWQRRAGFGARRASETALSPPSMTSARSACCATPGNSTQAAMRSGTATVASTTVAAAAVCGSVDAVASPSSPMVRLCLLRQAEASRQHQWRARGQALLATPHAACQLHHINLLNSVSSNAQPSVRTGRQRCSRAGPPAERANVQAQCARTRAPRAADDRRRLRSLGHVDACDCLPQ